MIRKMAGKRIVTSCLIFALCSSVVAGCSGTNGNGNASTGENKGNSPEASQATANGESGYPESLTYWAGLNTNVAATMTTYNDIAAYKELEKVTGTKVKFQHVSADQVADQLNLLLASGKLPDVIEADWVSVPKGPDNAIKEKRIIRLNELIEEHAPNLSKVLQDNPDFRKMVTSDDGNIYVFPYINGDKYLLTYIGPGIRQDWLDKLHLQMPTTINEWEEVLTAFRDQDPNGNNKKDEIPFFLDNWFISFSGAFVGAWGITTGFYQENGKVKYGPIQPQFKEHLETMSRWYKEGLIDREYAAADYNVTNSRVINDQVGSLMIGGNQAGKFDTNPPNGSFSLAGAPYPSLNAGEKAEIGQRDAFFSGIGAAITTSAKNPEQIVKWLDYKYSEAGHMLFNFGIEGESYTLVDNYPTYTDVIMKSPDGLPIGQAMAKYVLASFSGPFVKDRRYYEQYAGSPEQKAAISTWTQPSNEKLMPPVTLTADDGSKFASIMNDVSTYYTEMIDKFIMGAEPIDQFDDFVETITRMGIEEAVELQQAALDRYNKR
ncbi:extracellular solute-binding protein [Paenibacillus sp. PAMC21692]|uniref:extracellular solute-binding protein n=1 Tax=Paenibacillus sp. PAMC21692 TaxID=2762320 RepID=UPI0021C3E2AC|nr:extracellular solute-binding protein [Paenibacillus sp. PAMC21692]